MPNRTLWPHQQLALSACLSFLGRSPGYVQIPTGAGKSEIIRRLSLEWLTDRANKVVIAVPNHTLALQQRATFLLYGCGSEYPTLNMQNFRLSQGSRIIISTYQSLYKVLRLRQLSKHRTLIIADECHHCNESADSTHQIIHQYKIRIGFSATPWTEGCAFLFGDNLLFAQTLTQAQSDGFLCPYTIHEMEVLEPSANRKWQMYFVKDSSRFLSKILSNSVFYDDSVSETRPYQNKQIIDGFRDGLISCIYVNRMLLEGFDCPTVKDIYIEKQTTSDVLAMQMIGRGLRRLDNQICNIYVNNRVAYDSLHRAIERANNPERHAWHGRS